MYKVKPLGNFYVITKNGVMLDDKELGQINSFRWESLAIEVAELMEKERESP
jgi:hypothetical protein